LTASQYDNSPIILTTVKITVLLKEMKLSITDEFLWDVYRVIEKAGDIAAFMLNPRAVKFMPGMKNPIFEKYRHDKNKAKFKKLIHYAKTRGYIKVENLEGKKAVILTKEGLNKALKVSFAIERKIRRKDGKWIMVIFDVPEKYKKSRNLLRSILCNLGYKIFQKSVWITPYDVSGKTETLLQIHSLDEYVKIFLIEGI